MRLKKGTTLHIGNRVFTDYVPDELISDGLKNSKIWDEPEPAKAVKKTKVKNDD